MRFLVCWLLSLAVLSARAEEQMGEVEQWNEGVGYYESGDVTNALRVLRPLLLTKTYGARAAEVVAKLEHERGNREEAAVAAQIALRANPGDDKANRNFTRATDGLLAARETKHIDDVLKAAQGKDPGEMLRSATYDARSLLLDAGTYRTNAPARAVALSDALSARAERIADVWIPVREVIAQSVTNQEQAATILQQISEAQDKTKKAAGELSDLDGEAYSTMCDVENSFTRFLKLTVMPPAAIGEDLVAQTNAWLGLDPVNARPWQNEALDYTRAFRQKFPAWAKAYEEQAQSDTNKPPFTAEDQAKVSALSTELGKVQMECCEKGLASLQETALDPIRQIQELLPKDNSGQQGQQGQSGQNQQNQQNQDQKQDQNQDQQQQQEQQSESDERQQDQPEQQEEEKESDSQQDKQDDAQDQELEAVLKKAQERNDEHEADKKARMRKAPLPPNERDW